MSSDKMTSDFDLAQAASDTSVLDTAGSTNPASCAPIAPKAKPGRCRRAKQAFNLAWAAGFVDGEGCIFIYRQRYTANPKRNLAYRLGFSITQNDLQVLEHFQKGLGIAGGIYEVKRLLQHNRQIYELNYTGINALRAISMLQPFLVRKRLEAQTAIDYWAQGHCGKHPGPVGWPPSVVAIRERFYQKMKSLK